jgi:putative ABC transport system permease protein
VSRLTPPPPKGLVPANNKSPAVQRVERNAEPATPLETVFNQMRVSNRRPGRMLGASFGSATEALWANRLRSLLTALGIIIGIAAVIGALTLTQGVTALFNNTVASLGANTVYVLPGAAKSTGASQGASSVQTLTASDAQSLSGLPHVTSYTPVLTVTEQVVFGKQNWNTQIEGANPSIQTIQGWNLAEGTWFSDQDNTSGTAVAILGDTVMHNLFDTTGTDPIGQTIRMGGQLFKVSGVIAAKGSGQDDVIFVPFNTARIRLDNITTISQILVSTDSTSTVNAVQAEIATVMRKNHHLAAGATDDFQTISFSQYLQRFQAASNILTLLLVGIASISLTVGGIGIMNIMLVSVTERTREIGIRMSIGARRSDIRNQFLIEALLLCLVGGVIGLGLGLVVGGVMVYFFSMPFVVTPTTVLLPVLVSVAITVVFGLYPAVRAARLDPIEALRTEE